MFVSSSAENTEPIAIKHMYLDSWSLGNFYSNILTGLDFTKT